MKLAGYISVFVGGVVVCYLLISLGVIDSVDGIPGVQQEPEIALPTYLGFISAMMTAVTVVLAGVAIGIGIVAAYTFREIKNEVQREVLKVARHEIATALFEEAIANRINRIVYRQRVSGDSAELEENFDPDDVGER